MKTKKSQKADLESKRAILLELGFIISLGLVLLAFGWKSYEKTVQEFGPRPEKDVYEEMVPITEQKRPEPPKPQVPKISSIKIVDNDVNVDHDVVINAEADQSTEMPEYTPPPPMPEVKEEAPVNTKEIFVVVESMPSFPGGEQKLYEYLAQNLNYPVNARDAGIQGRVFVTFVVETDGSITDVRVLRGIGAGCDEEAVRVVKEMPKWIPGRQRGIPVRVQYNLPIKFVLQ